MATAKKAAAKKTAAKKTTASRDGSETTPPADVRPARYSDGEGFEAGQRAPHTLYTDRDRNKVGKSEFEDGGWVLVQAGDTVTPDTARIVADS